MTPRDFIVTPSSWLTDPKLNALSDDAELLFRRLAACTDKLWRFPYDPNALEHTVRTAVFSPQRRFRAWNPDRIRRGLNELTAAGMLIRHFQGDRHWLQVAEQYQYSKGRDPLGIAAPESKQPDLPDLEPGLAVLPPPRKHASPKPGTTRPVAGIPVRTESEQSIANESSTRPNGRPVNNSGTQELSLRKDSGNQNPNRFARDESAFPDDELWADLCRTLGRLEMFQHGAMWEIRFRENRTRVRAVLMDYLSKPPAERALINAGRYLTAAYRNEASRAS